MNTIGDWIFEVNLKPVLASLAQLSNYEFNEVDWNAFTNGMKDDESFCYSWDGQTSIEVDVFRESGESVYNLKVRAPEPYEQAIRIIMFMAQSFFLGETDQS